MKGTRHFSTECEYVHGVANYSVGFGKSVADRVVSWLVGRPVHRNGSS